MCGKRLTLYCTEGADISVEYLLVLRLVQFVRDTTEGKQAEGHGKTGGQGWGVPRCVISVVVQRLGSIAVRVLDAVLQ